MITLKYCFLVITHIQLVVYRTGVSAFAKIKLCIRYHWPTLPHVRNLRTYVSRYVLS